jgi:hypothetical protein
LDIVLRYRVRMKVRRVTAALLAVPGLAFGAYGVAPTAAASTTASPTGTLKLCLVEDKTGLPAAYYAITGRNRPVEVKAGTCRGLSAISVGDVQVYQVPEAGQNPSSITVGPASRQDGPADLSNGTVTVDIAPGATTTVTYTNQT